MTIIHSDAQLSQSAALPNYAEIAATEEEAWGRIKLYYHRLRHPSPPLPARHPTPPAQPKSLQHKPSATAKPGYVYLIQRGASDVFKIGMTTRNPQHRLFEIANNLRISPDELHVYAQWKSENPLRLEMSIHRALESVRQSGEWFVLQPKHLAIVEAMAQGDLW